MKGLIPEPDLPSYAVILKEVKFDGSFKRAFYFNGTPFQFYTLMSRQFILKTEQPVDFQTICLDAIVIDKFDGSVPSLVKYNDDEFVNGELTDKEVEVGRVKAMQTPRGLSLVDFMIDRILDWLDWAALFEALLTDGWLCAPPEMPPELFFGEIEEDSLEIQAKKLGIQVHRLERWREMVKLRYQEGKTNAQIAEIFSIDTGTVKKDFAEMRKKKYLRRYRIG